MIPNLKVNHEGPQPVIIQNDSPFCVALLDIVKKLDKSEARIGFVNTYDHGKNIINILRPMKQWLGAEINTTIAENFCFGHGYYGHEDSICATYDALLYVQEELNGIPRITYNIASMTQRDMEDAWDAKCGYTTTTRKY